ncbi:MAG: MogA/MoaB family molybdenum cofactor biosynthesis protein [Chitinivibrionales bacterium]|nr:MogA/MoaB family molybdenum cofactor biosynthesis protein [Chitinivibrionales bacterium]
MKVLVLTISDRASHGIYEDKSGPAIEQVLIAHLPDVSIERIIVPDDKEAILNAFIANTGAEAIITTGGTGIGPRDITPDVTENYCDRLIPGIAEYLRAESIKQTVNAAISRTVAGVKGDSIIVNLPGSVNGASFCAELLVPVLVHAVKMLNGEGH